LICERLGSRSQVSQDAKRRGFTFHVGALYLEYIS